VQAKIEQKCRRWCERPAVRLHRGAARADDDRDGYHGEGAGDPAGGARSNELATTQAEAAKKIAEAEGDAKSLVTRAQGEAMPTASGRIR